MTTFLLSIIVGQLILEAVCAYLIYKKRYQIQFAVQRLLGTDALNDRCYQIEASQGSILKRVKRIRAQQRSEADAINAQYGRKVV
jgi:hypothetical protein